MERKLILAIAVLIVTTLIFASFWYLRNKSTEARDDSGITEQVSTSPGRITGSTNAIVFSHSKRLSSTQMRYTAMEKNIGTGDTKKIFERTLDSTNVSPSTSHFCGEIFYLVLYPFDHKHIVLFNRKGEILAEFSPTTEQYGSFPKSAELRAGLMDALYSGQVVASDDCSRIAYMDDELFSDDPYGYRGVSVLNLETGKVAHYNFPDIFYRFPIGGNKDFTTLYLKTGKDSERGLTQFWSFDLNTKNLKEITAIGNNKIWDFGPEQFSTDKLYVAGDTQTPHYESEEDPFGYVPPSTIFLVDLVNNRAKILVKSETGPIYFDQVISQDGQQMAYFSEENKEKSLHYMDLKTGDTQMVYKLESGTEDSYGVNFVNGKLLAIISRLKESEQGVEIVGGKILIFDPNTGQIFQANFPELTSTNNASVIEIL